jgi:hypothetical protein
MQRNQGYAVRRVAPVAAGEPQIKGEGRVGKGVAGGGWGGVQKMRTSVPVRMVQKSAADSGY